MARKRADSRSAARERVRQARRDKCKCAGGHDVLLVTSMYPEPPGEHVERLCGVGVPVKRRPRHAAGMRELLDCKEPPLSSSVSFLGPSRGRFGVRRPSLRRTSERSPCAVPAALLYGPSPHYSLSRSITNLVTEPVKTRRAYHSPRRREQAERTRQRMLHAATRVFTARGYVGTTLADVAREAGVSEPNIYAVFGDKPRLLAAAIRLAVRGDEAGARLRDRPVWQGMLAGPDGLTMLKRFAALQREINARAWPLIDAARTAAASEQALAEQGAAGARNRWEDCHAVAAALKKLDELAPGISTRAATDMLWVMCSAEMHRMLAVDRRWSPKRHDAWVADVLTRQIVKPHR